MDHVRVPHIRPNPTKLFGEFDRSPAKLLRAVGRFVPRFSQVSMRMRSIRARELHTLSHERRRHGKWGARSQDNADHGIAAVVMIRLDDALGVAENCGLIFNQRVRRQAPLRLAQGHRAPSRVKAESHLGSSLDFVVDAGAVGPDVCVIAGRCATRKHQLGYRDLAARVDGLRRQPGPDGIVCPEPPEQIRILRRGETACQSLGKMVVRIDHIFDWLIRNQPIHFLDDGKRPSFVLGRLHDGDEVLELDEHAVVSAAAQQPDACGELLAFERYERREALQ